MKLRTGLVAALFVAGVLSVSTSVVADHEAPPAVVPEADSLNLSTGGIDTEDPIGDIYNTLPPDVTETINAMGEEPCALALRVLESQGFTVPEDTNAYEYDPLDGSCADLRDALEHKVWDGDDPPYIQYCQLLLGKNCVAIGHNACDFALLVGSGLVYVCLGGITPYN